MRAWITTGIAAAAALALAAGAAAGGWATVGVSPEPPDGGEAGAVWNPELNVLQHGRTPLDGVQPTIELRNRDTGERASFAARPTGESGRYAARVVFPSAGTWVYAVDDGFGRSHGFPPLTIAADGGSRLPAWLAGSAGLGAAALAAFALFRRRRPRTRLVATGA